MNCEETFFCFSDLLKLLKKTRRHLIKVGLIAALCALSLLLLISPKYTAVGIFRESSEVQPEAGGISELLASMAASAIIPQSIILFKTRKILYPLIQDQGLQATIKKESIPEKLLRRIGENIKVELFQSIPDLDDFKFQNVFYDQEVAFIGYIRFSTPKIFTLLNAKKEVLAEGEVGKEVRLDFASFTLAHAPSDTKLEKNYFFHIRSLEDTVKEISDKLLIDSHKKNKSLIKIAYCDRNRALATNIVNNLMLYYQDSLRRDMEHSAREQVAYLDKRHDQLGSKLDTILSEQANYFKRNLGKNGFISHDQELQSLFSPYSQSLERVASIDLELKKLDQIKGNYATMRSFHPEIFHELKNLYQQRDTLQMALHFRNDFSEETEFQIENHVCQLDEIRKNHKDAQKILENLQKKGEILETHLTQDPKSLVQIWASRLQQTKKNISENQLDHQFFVRDFEEQKQDFANYLQNYVHLLSVREKILEERLLQGPISHPEFEGIDLETAKKLYVQYNAKLDEIQLQTRNLQHVIEQLQNPDFEISSLGTFLTDPMALELVNKMSRITFDIRDEKNRSSKEQKRWQEELDLQRNFLYQHIQEMLTVLHNHADLIQDKIEGLQEITLDRINQQISILQEQATEAIKANKSNLLYEKKLVKDRLAQLQSEMGDLPEKWRLENQMRFKTNLGMRMMETIAQMVESKTVSYHLQQVESKPLEIAITPTLPDRRNLVITALFLGFFASLVALIIHFFRTATKGFPASKEILQAFCQHVLGSITFFCDGPQIDHIKDSDLETLRKIVHFSSVDKILALISGNGPNYSHALAEIFAKKGDKVLLVQCSFRSIYQKKDTPGLMQYLEKTVKQCPIRKVGTYDFLPAGGTTRFGSELIGSQSFIEFLQKVQNKYDKVLLYSRSMPESAEARIYLQFAEKVIVTTDEETIDLLTPFTQWAYHGGICRLSFVTQET